MGVWDSAHKKLVDCESRVYPFTAVAVAPLSFFTQPSNKLLVGTDIGADVTVADVPPAPGSAMGEKIGGPVTSDWDTAKIWNTRGAGLLSCTVTVWLALVAELFT